MPPVYDQGQLGSCTGNAIAGAFEYELIKEAKTPFVPSRLFIYYQERVLEGDVSGDNGAQIRDGMKVVAKLGAPHETLWPYKPAKFAAKPSAKAYADGLKHTVSAYKRVNNANLTSLLSVLASAKPIVFGFTCYESLESEEVAKTGVLPMPSSGEQVIGGHAVVLCGYDRPAQTFTVRNSWGPAWGMKGYFTMPFDYVANTDLCDDFWTISSVSA